MGGEARGAIGENVLIVAVESVFDAAGEAWMFAPGVVYRVENRQRVKVEPAPTLLAAAPGPGGGIWIVGGSGNRTALWKLEK